LQLVCEAVAIGRGGVLESFPAFFPSNPDNSTKILKVEVNWKLKIQMLWSQRESHKTGVAKRTIRISPP
jgi:hypothetical protein